MKFQSKLLKTYVATLLLVGAVAKSDAVTYTVDPLATWNGYMNVFDNINPGYGMAAAGGYQFGSPWGTADLRATFTGPTLSLKANTINPPSGLADAYWFNPNQTGNKIMDANFYQEFNGPLAGQNVTFTGNVLANSLLGPVDLNGRGWTAVAFIKDFAPDFSSSVSTTVPLTSLGVFSISQVAINDPARHLQFGFEVIGPDVWSANSLAIPSVDIGPVAVPEPTSMALAGIGAALLVIRRRK